MRFWRYYEFDDQLVYLYQEICLEAHLDGSTKLVQHCLGGIRFDGQHMWTPFLPLKLKTSEADVDMVQYFDPTTLLNQAKQCVEAHARADVHL